MDLSLPFQIRAQFNAQQAMQGASQGYAATLQGIQTLVAEQMQVRRMALASAWAFRNKMDTAQAMSTQLGIPVMPGESPGAAVRRTKAMEPPAPKVDPDEVDLDPALLKGLIDTFDAGEDAADRARAASGSQDKDAYARAASDHAAAKAAFMKYADQVPDDVWDKVVKKYLTPAISKGRRGGGAPAGMAPPKEPPKDKEMDDREWIAKYGETYFSEPADLPPEALATVPPSMAASVAARVADAKKFKATVALKKERFAVMDKAREEARKSGDLGKLESTLVSEINQIDGEIEENSYVETNPMTGQKTFRVKSNNWDVELRRRRQEREAELADVRKRLQGNVGMGPTFVPPPGATSPPPAGKVNGKNDDRMRELLTQGDARTPEEDAEFLRLTEK